MFQQQPTTLAPAPLLVNPPPPLFNVPPPMMPCPLQQPPTGMPPFALPPYGIPTRNPLLPPHSLPGMPPPGMPNQGFPPGLPMPGQGLLPLPGQGIPPQGFPPVLPRQGFQGMPGPAPGFPPGPGMAPMQGMSQAITGPGEFLIFYIWYFNIISVHFFLVWYFFSVCRISSVICHVTVTLGRTVWSTGVAGNFFLGIQTYCTLFITTQAVHHCSRGRGIHCFNTFHRHKLG